MNMKLICGVLLLASVAPASAQAQQQPNLPKMSKAEVQKVVDSIKGDKAKMARYCDYVKLEDQGEAIASKNPKDPKLQSLRGQMMDTIKKVGPDFEKLMNSDLDQASGTLLEDLAKGCD